MQYKQASVASTLVAVQRFIAKHPNRLHVVAQSEAGRQLNQVSIELEANARSQAARTLTARTLTQKRAEARRRLIDVHMYPIAQVARMEIANYANIPALHLPRLNIGDAELLDAAGVMAAAARACAEVFLGSLADKDFVVSLERAADHLRNVLRERAECLAHRQHATACLAVCYRNARHRLRVIDRVITARVSDDPRLLNEWNNTRQVMMKPSAPRLVVAKES